MNGLLKAGLFYEAGIQVREFAERRVYRNRARRYCASVDKPLLRIGVRRSVLEPPNGDVTLDLDPAVERIPGGFQGDVRRMPFADKQFGVCFCEHVLEHLETPEDVALAVDECRRVADVAVLLCPSPYSIWGSCFNITHNLRVWFHPNGDIQAAPNRWRTGLGFPIMAPVQQVRAYDEEGV